MPRAGKIPRQPVRGDANGARGGRGIAAPPDEARLAGRDHSANSGDVAVADGGERRVLSSSVGRVDEREVRRLAGGDEARLEAVDARIAAGRRGDGKFRRDVGKAREMG